MNGKFEGKRGKGEVSMGKEGFKTGKKLMIIGLCAGLVVSTFSRSLALILGLLVVGVQVSQIFENSREK